MAARIIGLFSGGAVYSVRLFEGLELLGSKTDGALHPLKDLSATLRSPGVYRLAHKRKHISQQSCAPQRPHPSPVFIRE